MYADEDSIDAEVDGNDLEIIEQGDDEIHEEINEETTEQNTENQEETENENRTVKKPKRVIKNPQPKLNSQTLQEPKGLSAIQGYFDRVKFKGRGYEEQDLNVLMKTYEYWCHRLVPKFSFDDCIARLETLGTKKITQTQIKRIRMDLNTENPADPVLSEEEEENHTADSVDTPNDQFDQLLPSTNETRPEISEEQMERIRQNKEKAQRLREERLRKIREKAENNLEPSRSIIENDQPSTSKSQPDSISVISTENLNSVIEHQQLSVDQTNSENRLETEEDNIDNILNFINSDDPGYKRKNTELESDSEDEIVASNAKKSAGKSNSRRKCILDSDEDEVPENIDKSNEIISFSKMVDCDKEDGDVNIDNILMEINADDDVKDTTEIQLHNRTNSINRISSWKKVKNIEDSNEKENYINTLEDNITNEVIKDADSSTTVKINNRNTSQKDDVQDQVIKDNEKDSLENNFSNKNGDIMETDVMHTTDDNQISSENTATPENNVSSDNHINIQSEYSDSEKRDSLEPKNNETVGNIVIENITSPTNKPDGTDEDFVKKGNSVNLIHTTD